MEPVSHQHTAAAGKAAHNRRRRLALYGQVLVAGIAAGIFSLMVWLPTTEGRAAGLDLPAIYADPFILYGYVSSIAFYTAMYKTFRVLGYIRQDKIHTPQTIAALKYIQCSALLLSLLTAAAGGYIRLYHAADDDPAGFLATCAVIILTAVVGAAAARVFEKRAKSF